MRYLLDANHLSPLVTLSHPLRQRVLDRVSANDQFFVSVPVITETLFGFHGTARAAANFRDLGVWGRAPRHVPLVIFESQAQSHKKDVD